jgi:hypothetical protein
VIDFIDELEILLGDNREILEKAIQQSIVCGTVTIKITDNGTLEIVDLFVGCCCGEKK